MREVRRVLRDDGVCWLNLGDSFYNYRPGNYNDARPQGFVRQVDGGGEARGIPAATSKRLSRQPGLKEKDLVGIPWRVALALQADGWYLRSDVIWFKLNPMPESVFGWHWERCKVRVKASARAMNLYRRGADGNRLQGPGVSARAQREAYFGQGIGATQWADCPGCKKCEPTGGYVLRRGSWRPTSAHEYVFMLAKTGTYFADKDAVKEPLTEASAEGLRAAAERGQGRNLRDVWGLTTEPFGFEFCQVCGSLYTHGQYRRLWAVHWTEWNAEQEEWLDKNSKRCRNCGEHDGWLSHFATFPSALIEPCIKASTSEKGVCPQCGDPWVRVIEQGGLVYGDAHRRPTPTTRGDAGRHPENRQDKQPIPNAYYPTKTIGWRPSCSCNAGDPVPATVLDPFAGSGTTGLVADRLGRNAILVELNSQYAELSAERIRGDAGMFAQVTVIYGNRDAEGGRIRMSDDNDKLCPRCGSDWNGEYCMGCAWTVDAAGRGYCGECGEEEMTCRCQRLEVEDD